jgi:AcrR family transcriptional regulator
VSGRRNSKRAVSLNGSTKEIIEKQATTLFSDKGYDATSMREIAEAAGVTKPVIYYYFKNKEQLCNHLISSGLEEFRQNLQHVNEAKNQSVLEQIIQMVDIHFDFCKRHIELMRFIYAVNFGPDRKKINYDFYAYSMEIFRMQMALMRKAVKAGLLREGNEERAVYYLRGIISTFAMLFIDGRHRLNSNLARTIVVDLLNGLGAADLKVHKASGAYGKA